MTIEQILHDFEPGDELTVLNEPFSYKSKAVITLDGGDVRYWLFSEEDNMLTLSPDDEEIVFFRYLEEEVEPEDEMALVGGKEYEFSYEDAGVVTEIDGEMNAEEDDRFSIADYEGENGDSIRLLTNENNGEVISYHGKIVVEEDVAKL
jgi:hypothetical protein